MTTTRLTSHPTRYRGIQFRSRLEATWAAFFDGVQWPWEYEPLELPGYIPDFVLRFTKPILVEVKPAVTEADLTAVAVEVEPIIRGAWHGEALLLGIGPYATTEAMDGLTIGLLGERWDDERDRVVLAWGDGRLFRCGACHQLSVMHAIQSYRCRVCGVNDHHWGDAAVAEFHMHWAGAKNAVQWQPARPRNGVGRPMPPVSLPYHCHASCCVGECCDAETRATCRAGLDHAAQMDLDRQGFPSGYFGDRG